MDILFLLSLLFFIAVLISLGFAKGNSYLVLLGGVGTFLFGILLLMGVEYVAYIETNTSLTMDEIYIYGDNYTDYHFDHYGSDPSPSLNDVKLFHRNTSSVTTESKGEVIKTWSSEYNPYLAFFFMLTGLVLILVGGITLAWGGDENPKKRRTYHDFVEEED